MFAQARASASDGCKSLILKDLSVNWNLREPVHLRESIISRGGCQVESGGWGVHLLLHIIYIYIIIYIKREDRP